MGSDATEHPTCGQGLAANAEIPERLSVLMSSMADVLENHMQALDLADVDSRAEHEVYGDLVDRARRGSLELLALADEMASHCDLPMGKHDPAEMGSPAAIQAFEGFLSAQRELLALLERHVAQDDDVLVEMRRTGD